MRSFRFLVILFLIPSAFFLGCTTPTGIDPALVGTWEYSSSNDEVNADYMENNYDVFIVTLNPDNTCSQYSVAIPPAPPVTIEGIVTCNLWANTITFHFADDFDYTYEIGGDSLTLIDDNDIGQTFTRQ